jgi:hypothetical protein
MYIYYASYLFITTSLETGLGRQTCHLPFTVRKRYPTLGNKVTILGHMGQSTINKMFDTCPTRNLVHPDTLEYLVLLANGKAVGVDETQINTLKGRPKGIFIVVIPFDQLDIRESTKLCGVKRTGGPSQDKYVLGTCCGESSGGSTVLGSGAS